MRIKKCFEKITTKVCLVIAKRMSPVIKEAIDNPENLKFEGYINGDEFIIKVKVKIFNKSINSSFNP